MFNIYLNKPNREAVTIKLYTDYDNYVKIRPKTITFPEGSTQKIPITIGLSKSYSL